MNMLSCPHRSAPVAARGAILSILALPALLAVAGPARAQATGSQEGGNIKNPKECVQAELVWAEARDSEANSLIPEYVFPYPEGIRVRSRCDKDVKVVFGVDAALRGIAGNLARDAGGTSVDFSEEEVLRCETFPTLSFNLKSDFAEFPESVRDTGAQYHYERARRLVNLPDQPDIWNNLHWAVRYRGCVEWTDEAMKIGTGYRQRCLTPCPGDTVLADYHLSGEVVQESEISQHTVEQEQEIIAVMTEPKCLVEYGYDTFYERESKVIRNGMEEDEKGCWFKISNRNECYTYYEWNADSNLSRESRDSDILVDGGVYIPLEISWSGECSNGVATGKGTLKWLDDDEYKGELVNGKRHGQWTFHDNTSWPSDTINYKNGTMHGLHEEITCITDQVTYSPRCIRKTNYQSGVRHGIEEKFMDGRLYEKNIWENGEKTSGSVEEWVYE